MMPTRLYYNKQVGKNLIGRIDGADVWNDYQDGYQTDIHYVLNILGIK